MPWLVSSPTKERNEFVLQTYRPLPLHRPEQTLPVAQLYWPWHWCIVIVVFYPDVYKHKCPAEEQQIRHRDECHS